MPEEPFFAFTNSLVAHLGGPSPKNLEVRSSPRNWSEFLFEGPFVDETTDGDVKFLTAIDFGNSTLADVSHDAWRRALCFYVVGRLSGKALHEACESLADIYTWQIDQTRAVAQIPEKRRHMVTKVRQVDRAPLFIDED